MWRAGPPVQDFNKAGPGVQEGEFRGELELLMLFYPNSLLSPPLIHTSHSSQIGKECGVGEAKRGSPSANLPQPHQWASPAYPRMLPFSRLAENSSMGIKMGINFFLLLFCFPLPNSTLSLRKNERKTHKKKEVLEGTSPAVLTIHTS